MIERLKRWYSWFTPSRTVGLLLDVAIVYSSWKLYGVLIPLATEGGLIPIFNSLMMLGFGLTIHRVSRRIGTVCRVLAMVALYSLKFGTAGVYSLVVHVPEIEVHKQRHEYDNGLPVNSFPTVTLVRQISAEPRLRPAGPTPGQIVDCGLYLWKLFPVEVVLTILLTWLSTVIGDILALFLEWVHYQVDDSHDNGVGHLDRHAPPPLPDIKFEGATGTQDALQQPAVGLTIASAYPLALTGSLTLAFNSDVFSNDPAVQFATGGRTVAFTIPANSTRAIFANNQNQIRVQSGSLAGSITLTPSINTTEGSINLTPTTPPTLTLNVAPAAPRILGVALGSKTTTTITLLISGYATNRSVTTMRLQFTPVSGENVGTTDVTVPVEASFLGYYQGLASAPFGSLFTVSVPLTLAGDIKNVTSVTDTVQSVAVTLTNRVGTSNSVPLTLR